MLKVKVIYQLNYYIELACIGLRLKFLLIKTPLVWMTGAS